jgi:hypothetical protein
MLENLMFLQATFQVIRSSTVDVILGGDILFEAAVFNVHADLVDRSTAAAETHGLEAISWLGIGEKIINKTLERTKYLS